jgi:hypothetical protein
VERTPHNKRTGQTKAGAASCPLDAIGEDRPGPWCAQSWAPAGAQAAGIFRTPSGHHLHSGADVIRHQNVSKSPDQDERAVGKQCLNEPKPVAPRPVKGGPRPRFGSSRSIPRNDRSPVGTPSTHWWRYASRDRTHRSARDWQRYVVGKVPLSPQAAEDPGAGAGGVATIKVAGARAGELTAGSTIEPGGRLKGLGTHPSPSATRNESGLGWTPSQ